MVLKSCSHSVFFLQHRQQLLKQLYMHTSPGQVDFLEGGVSAPDNKRYRDHHLPHELPGEH